MWRLPRVQGWRSSGYLRANWLKSDVMMRRVTCLFGLAAIAAIAACGGSSGQTSPSAAPLPTAPTSTPPIPAGLSPALTAMLQGLSAYISAALAENQDLLPRNPQSASQLQAKIAMLQNPSLAADIINDRRWAEGQVTSMNSRIVPIVTVFPLETMRSEATQAVRTLEPVLPLLEGFFNAPFPTSAVRVWYGFKIGNTGGGGVIYSEDRTTYEGRAGCRMTRSSGTSWATRTSAMRR